MAKKEYLEGYEKGLKAAKAGEGELPEKYYKNKIHRLIDGPGYFDIPAVKEGKLKGIENDKYLDTDEGRGDAQGRKEMNKAQQAENRPATPMKKGGKITAANYDKEYGKIYRKAVKKMSSGGTASSRADGIAVKGKTRGKIC
jgi:hypothetical protein